MRRHGASIWRPQRESVGFLIGGCTPPAKLSGRLKIHFRLASRSSQTTLHPVFRWTINLVWADTRAGRGNEPVKFEELLRLNVDLVGRDADAHRLPAGDFAALISSVSNISRRSAVLAAGGANPSVRDMKEIQTFVEPPSKGSFEFEILIAVVGGVVANVAAVGIVETIKAGYEYVRRGDERRLEEAASQLARAADAGLAERIANTSEQMRSSYLKMSALIGKSADRIKITTSSKKTGLFGSTETLSVIEISATEKAEIETEIVSPDGSLFVGRVRRFDDDTGKGAIELKDGTRVRFWTAQGRLKEIAPHLIANMSANNNENRGKSATVPIVARTVTVGTGQLKRIVIDQMA